MMTTRQFKCHVCHRGFNSRSALGQHFSSQHGPGAHNKGQGIPVHAIVVAPRKPRSWRNTALIIFLVFALVAFGTVMIAQNVKADDYGYKDYKAPRPVNPPVSLKESKSQAYKDAVSKILINRIVEQDRLPYITVTGHDLKVAIDPHVLRSFGLKSGDSVSAVKMQLIIDADRKFEKAFEDVVEDHIPSED